MSPCNAPIVSLSRGRRSCQRAVLSLGLHRAAIAAVLVSASVAPSARAWAEEHPPSAPLVGRHAAALDPTGTVVAFTTVEVLVAGLGLASAIGTGVHASSGWRPPGAWLGLSGLSALTNGVFAALMLSLDLRRHPELIPIGVGHIALASANLGFLIWGSKNPERPPEDSKVSVWPNLELNRDGGVNLGLVGRF